MEIEAQTIAVEATPSKHATFGKTTPWKESFVVEKSEETAGIAEDVEFKDQNVDVFQLQDDVGMFT